jgi:hypothetical protein
MTRHQSSTLLAALLALFAARGLAPEALDPWRAWVVFKQFARDYSELPDHGVSVQIDPVGPRGPIHLFFVRQVLARAGGRLEPVGGVACELVFASGRRTPKEWREWTFDHLSFERFVDAVEQHPAFADLLLTSPIHTAVYWQHA